MSQLMTLKNILTDKKNSILKKWLELIADTHPAGSGFFKNKDQFTNPVGYTISTEISTLYDELLQGQAYSEKIAQSLDNIIKIRAVQDFSPSKAIGFLFLLKAVLNDELKDEIQEKLLFKELLQFNSTIDEMGLLAFDIYTSCRERIYKIQVNEIKTDRENAFRLLERIRSKSDKLEDGVADGYNRSEVTG